MNTNLLDIVKQIIADYGEVILEDPRRLKALFGDLAKDEPKPLRIAFGRCIESGAYTALKNESDATERTLRKTVIGQNLRDEHGLDPALCAEALDILEAALYGKAQTAYQPPQPNYTPQQPASAQTYMPPPASVYAAPLAPTKPNYPLESILQNGTGSALLKKKGIGWRIALTCLVALFVFLWALMILFSITYEALSYAGAFLILLIFLIPLILLCVLLAVMIKRLKKANEWNTEVDKLIQNNMVGIDGGTFTMGSPASEPGRNDGEGPLHQVTVSSFYLVKYEVTVEEFGRFAASTGYRTEAETDGGGWVWENSGLGQKADANWRNPYFSQNNGHPVVLVSWNDAIRYCNWRSENEGLTPAYTKQGNDVMWEKNASGYRLPTEAEWEYACRAGTATPFNTGSNITTSQANYNGKYPYNGNPDGIYQERTSEVGSFAPNSRGLYDMHGNVYEWCWDWYGDYSGIAQTDPAGADSGSGRVMRGGSWLEYGQNLRSAGRFQFDPSYRRCDVGFRLVRPALC
jgi:formylglycine-generating enzyme required for sulfatase activity